MKRLAVQHFVTLVLLSITLGGPLAAAEAPAGEQIPADVCADCHETQYDAIRNSAHWRVGDARTPGAKHECATCHGNLEEHAMSEGEQTPEGMRVFGRASLLTAEEQNALCMSCHKASSLVHWQGSAHDANEVGCVGCHRIHGEDRVRSREREQEVCFTCHAELRGDVYKPYGHPLREEKMSCSDCHAAHGGPGDAEMKTFSTNETCYTCHAEKRGPFLWEHPPVSENCVLCHSAHGSVHAGMLERREPHLCQSCHEPTALAESGPPHARHSRLALSFREPGEEDIGINPAGDKGISRFVMGEACSNCHSQVHGSNHPAGAKLTR